ncbi:hypothetical protein RIR_jg15834.t1 [Rhizophagus irregularis DAOM 181602=DAOM 197198]|nr:hypothetical protein RIR_jg15834.t1 [Rhizophagus irregularis DAOM 181602=DAOM 197198]
MSFICWKRVDSCNALYRIVYKFSLYLSTIPIPLTEFISFKSKKPFVRICRWITLYDKETTSLSLIIYTTFLHNKKTRRERSSSTFFIAIRKRTMICPKELGNKQKLVPGKYFDKTILVVITLYIKISRAETIYLNIPKQCIFIFSYKGLTKFIIN